jgi:ATP-dependent RNA helicase DDX50
MLRKIFSCAGSAYLKSNSSASAGIRTCLWKSIYAESNLLHRNSDLVRYFSSAVAAESGFAKGRGFHEFEGISQTALDIFKKHGFERSFPVQEATWDKVMEGKSLIVREKTGAGKTLGYVLPALEKLRMKAALADAKAKRTPKILVLVPTRELCIQVTNQFSQMLSNYREFYICSLYGGTSIFPQLEMLERGIDIVVATPGRLNDVMGRGSFNGSNIDMVVLDETDQMLDIGFAQKITDIVEEIKSQRSSSGPNLQCLLFSATIPKWVQQASKKLMDTKPEFINLISEDDMKTPASVKHYAIQIGNMQAANSMIPFYLRKYLKPNGRAIIFTNTKHECESVNESLLSIIHSKVLNGDVSQVQRERVFNMYKSGKLRCLVATNVAARGLDFPQVDLVIQLSPPQDIESYVHRAGRTARAGNSGVCITFYTRRDAQTIERISDETGATFETLQQPTQDEINNLQRIESNLTAEDQVDQVDYRSATNADQSSTRQYSNYDDTIPGHTRVQFEFDTTVQLESYDMNTMRRFLIESCDFRSFVTETKKTGILRNSKGFVAMIPSSAATQLDSMLSTEEVSSMLSNSGVKVSFPAVRPRTVNPYSSGGDRNSRGGEGYSRGGEGYSRGGEGYSRGGDSSKNYSRSQYSGGRSRDGEDERAPRRENSWNNRNQDSQRGGEDSRRDYSRENNRSRGRRTQDDREE